MKCTNRPAILKTVEHENKLQDKVQEDSRWIEDEEDDVQNKRVLGRHTRNSVKCCKGDKEHPTKQ